MNTVTISLDDYNEMMVKVVKYDLLMRKIKGEKYLSKEDILTAFGEEDEEDNE